MKRSSLTSDTHTLRSRRAWASSDDLHQRVPVENPVLIGLDLPLPSLIGLDLSLPSLIDVAGRSKILTYTQINKNNKSQSLSDYAQQDLSITTRRPRILDMEGFK
jgi:hypothetical protein